MVPDDADCTVLRQVEESCAKSTAVSEPLFGQFYLPVAEEEFPTTQQHHSRGLR